MLGNKTLVRQLLSAYLSGDREGVAEMLSENVQYEVVGRFRVFGKYEYVQHLFQVHFAALPDIKVMKETCEGTCVSTEGTILAHFPDGTPFHARFHNAYEFSEGLLVKQCSYVIPVIME
jgi:ketosteroid isomerase-like protein